jgi:kojibiose phosphorylase
VLVRGDVTGDSALHLALDRLRGLGVDVVVLTADPAALVNGGTSPGGSGPGRLFAWSGDPPEVYEIGAGTAPTSLRLAPPASPNGHRQGHDAPPMPAHPAGSDDPVAWARDQLLGEKGPEGVLEIAAPDALHALADEILAVEDRFPSAVDDPAWRLDVEGFDPLREREVESWLTVANGRTGTRGSIEEGSPHSQPATYVAGVFGRVGGDLPGRELVRGPQWTRLAPRTGDGPVHMEPGQIVEQHRVLDLRQGILFRTWRQRLADGREWDFRSARFASLADRAVLAMQAAAEVDGQSVGVSLAVEVPLDDDQRAVASAETRTDDGRTSVTLNSNAGGTVTFTVSDREDAGAIERLVAVHRVGIDGGSEPAEETLARAQAAGTASLRARHRREWRARWQDSDVVVEGDLALQQAVRFAIAHLISSGDPESDVASIGARGLSGPGYHGHVFWDTEVFVLPFFIWTHPPTARALLSYRHRTLPAARAKARAMGYSGALYAWESADSGEETTPLFAWLPNGTRIEILTGQKEHHISADIAWATWQYWRTTGDDAFLLEKGAEMILETARFWASRAVRGHDGRFHIDDVIGPDEYHEGVADNAFTNVLARWNLRAATALCELVPELDPEAWGRLRASVDLVGSEPAWWNVVADNLVDGFDPQSLLYEQFAGFFGQEHVLAVDIAPRPYAADSLLGVQRVRHAQIVKQADVLMFAHMLPDEVPLDVVAANYRYYEPRTSHGSSLSPAVHAAVAARVGALDDADWYFRTAATIDLGDHMGNAAHGLHLATMGGLWQAAVLGFGGVRADGDALRIDPHPPSSWPRLAFSIRWRGTRVGVDVRPDAVYLDLGGPVVIEMGDGPSRPLGTGRYVARRAASGWEAPKPSGHP